MDTIALLVVPPAGDRSEVDLREIDSAIELVRCGAATRVRLAGVASSGQVVGLAVARAQAAGIHIRIDPATPTPVLTFGPAERRRLTTE